MTPVDTKSIRERADKASAGPWRVARMNVDDSGAEFAGDCKEVECEPGEAHLYVEVRDGTPGHIAITCDEEGVTTAPEAEFIAHARTDVPALCDAVDQLRAEVERLRGIMEDDRKYLHRIGTILGVDDSCLVFSDIVKAAKSTRAEVERLTRERDEEKHRGDCNLRSISRAEDQLAACQAERDEAQDGIASIIVKWSKDKDEIADLQLALTEAREVQRIARTSTLVKALDEARRETFEATREAAADRAYRALLENWGDQAAVDYVRALTLADISTLATTKGDETT